MIGLQRLNVSFNGNDNNATTLRNSDANNTTARVGAADSRAEKNSRDTREPNRIVHSLTRSVRVANRGSDTNRQTEQPQKHGNSGSKQPGETAA